MAPPAVSVLFVDDEEDIAEAFAELLQALYGWTVERAHSGREALQKMRSMAFDVIVSDYRMPRMSGLDLLRKAHKVAPSTPFILLTAYGDAELEAASLREGAARFLGKAASPRDIAASIEEVLASPAGAPRRGGPRGEGEAPRARRRPPQPDEPQAPAHFGPSAPDTPSGGEFRPELGLDGP